MVFFGPNISRKKPPKENIIAIKDNKIIVLIKFTIVPLIQLNAEKVWNKNVGKK